MQNEFFFSCLFFFRGKLGDIHSKWINVLVHFDRIHSHILSGGQTDSHHKQIQRNKMINAHAQNSKTCNKKKYETNENK